MTGCNWNGTGRWLVVDRLLIKCIYKKGVVMTSVKPFRCLWNFFRIVSFFNRKEVSSWSHCLCDRGLKELPYKMLWIISSIGNYHWSLNIFFYLCFRAVNIDNKGINKVKNQLTGEFGSVPETARHYKVSWRQQKLCRVSDTALCWKCFFFSI